MAELDNAIETVKNPLEVWERGGNRLVYYGKFKTDQGKAIVLQVESTLDGIVDSYHLKTRRLNNLNKNRSGKLRFSGGTGGE